MRTAGGAWGGAVPAAGGSRIMLELGGNELPGHLGRAIAADAGLRVPLQFVQGGIHGLLVSLAHALIAADKRGQRNRLGCAESRIPAGAMFYRRNCLTFLVLVLMHLTVPNQLLPGLWVLPFRETGELIGADATGQGEFFGQPAVPPPLNGVVLLPIILLGGGELLGVVGLRLGCRERFRDGQHGRFTPAESGLGVHRYRE